MVRLYTLIRGGNWDISEFRSIFFFDLILLPNNFTVTFYKGHLISKCLFGVFNFFQKTNKNKSTWCIIVVKSNSFVRFLEETSAWKNHFEFVWPLAVPFPVWKIGRNPDCMYIAHEKLDSQKKVKKCTCNLFIFSCRFVDK